MEPGSETPISHSEIKPKKENIINIQAESVPSDKHPDRNEDAWFQIGGEQTGWRQIQCVVGVFDGMGGHAAGNVASQTAQNYVNQFFCGQHPQDLPQGLDLSKGLSLEQAKELIYQALVKANEVVYKKAQDQGNNMGTTATVALIWEGPNGELKLIVGNVGDSRAYLLRRGQLTQLTLDDGLVRSEVLDENKARELQAKFNNVTDPEKELSILEKVLFNNRNLVIQYLGQPTINPRLTIVDLSPGDTVLLCSDGIPDNLIDKHIKKTLLDSNTGVNKAEELVKYAQAKSKDRNYPRAKPDDMTAIVVEIGSKPSEVKPAPSQPDQELKIGNEVFVQRSDGKIEPGWKINNIDIKTGMATVYRDMNGQRLQKQIPLKDLQILNMIQNAQSPEELFSILKQLGSLQGSKRPYSSAELIKIIEAVLSYKEILQKVTNAYGLRQKVAKLMTEENNPGKK